MITKDDIVKVLVIFKGVENQRATGRFLLPTLNEEQRSFLKGIAEDIMNNWEKSNL